MGKFLLSVVLLLMLCAFTGAQIPDDYDMPPAKLKVKRPRAYEYGEYGVVMDERQSTVLKCTAEGRPAPTYSWQKDGNPVNTTDPRITVEDGVLTIEVPTTDDEGQYQCFATNPYGTALSPKYKTVYAFQAPYTDVTPKEFEFNVGEEVLLDCGAPDGAPKPTIYWVDEDSERLTLSERMAFTEEGGLYFSNVEKADEGVYYCFTGNNLLGTFMRSPARFMDVNSGTATPRAAAISHLSTETEGLREQSKAIRCLATGYPTPEISWFRDGQQLPEASLQNFNQDLYFDSLTFGDGGSYECRASNEHNSQPDTRSVLLTVESAPYFATPVRDVVIAPGGIDEIICHAGGVPKPELKWLQNGGPFRMAEGSPYQLDGDTIRIIEPLEGQSTVFQCILENVHGERVGSYTITVLAIPATITVKPEEEVVESEGDVVSLSCTAFGSPTPTIEWHKDDVKLDHGGRIIIEESGESDAVVSTLNVTDLIFDDGGLYTCHALNSVGNSSASSDVLIRFPTNATIEPSELMVTMGDPAIFTCDVQKDALAVPTWSWFFNDVKIESRGKRGEFEFPAEDQLRVKRTKASHTGTFKCVVKTEYDSDSSTAQLIVQAAPDAPYNVVLDIVGLQASLSWAAPSNNNAEISSYRIQWRTQHDTFPEPQDPSLAPWDTYKEISASSTTSEDIELGNYLTYSFRVIAINKIGASPESEVATGEMTPAAPPGDKSMPGNVRSTDDKPGKLTVSWDEVHPYYHNGPDYGYVVRWRRPGETEWQTAVITDPSVTTFEIDGDEYEEIEYSVGVANDVDDGPEPTPQTATTGQGRPSAAPGNVQLLVIGSNEINVTWEAVPEGDINGALEHYVIYYRMQAGQGTEQSMECPGDQTSCVLGGLEAFTSYEVSVAVVNALQEGPRSDPVTIRTAEGVPTKPENLMVESTSYRVSASWEPPAKENGVHRGYNVIIVASDGDEIVSRKNETIEDKDELTFMLEEADPALKYEIKVTAYTAAGDGPPAMKSSDTGPAGVPPLAGKPELDQAGDTHLNVTWPPVGDNDPKPDEVRACIKAKDGEEKKCEYTDWVDVLAADMIHIDELEAETEYVVFLEQRNKEGLTPGRGPEGTFKTVGKGAVTTVGALQPWFIAIICVIILLLLILLIICILKSQKGGKYNVSDKENQLKDESAPLKNNDGFAEFNNSDFPDDIEGSQDSLASNPDDDGDSLKEYADDEDPSKFNEEGSFIEEYHDPKPRSTDQREGGTSTFV